MDVDDIDDLLDEVEQGFNKTKTTEVAARSDLSERSARTTTTEDLDSLLTDLPDVNTAAPNGPRGTPPAVGTQDKKCWPPYLTGSYSSASVRSCTHLRCLKCDCAVVSFDGWQWSPDVTYLFLRNNYPSIEKLRAKLQPRRTCRAYACQCRSVATAEPVALTASEDHTWICSGKPS